MSVNENNLSAERVPLETSGGNAEAPPFGLVQLERQVERGSFFTHTALGENRLRLNEVESFTYGLIDTLLAKGVVSAEEVEQAAENVRGQLMSNDPGMGVALRVETEEAATREPVQVDCAARMHICKAVCCKLDFALTKEEVEGGKVKWDLGRPYFLRHEADGLCTHCERSTGKCGIYEDRPGTCRNYSCVNDERIWKDFEKMELNTEWLSENLYESRPRALRVLMQPVQSVPAGSELSRELAESQDSDGSQDNGSCFQDLDKSEHGVQQTN